MKFADIKAGHVYGYYEGRDLRYRGITPVLVLEAAKYVQARGEPGVEPAGDRRMQRGGWNSRTVGIPGVRLADGTVDVAEVLARASVAGFVHGRDVTAEDGTVLGTYLLVAQSFYLHGDYAELVAEEQEQERQRKAAREEKDRRDAETAEHRAALLARLRALGIETEPPRMLPVTLKLVAFELGELDKLITLAEAGKQSA
jgi:hypothetical protein